MVTAVIVDYRAFDTMFETTVMFLAGVAVILILAYHPKRRLIVPTRFRRFDSAAVRVFLARSLDCSDRSDALVLPSNIPFADSGVCIFLPQLIRASRSA